MISALVTGINGQVASQFAQSLKPADYRVVGVDSNPLARLLYPPHPVDRCLVLPLPDTDEQLVGDLAATVESESIDVLVVTGIEVIRAFAKLGNPTTAKLLIPDGRIVELCQSKWLTYRALAGRVPVPDTIAIQGLQDLTTAKERFGLPYWIRSHEGQAANTAFCADNLEDAELWIRLKRGWGKFSASEYLPGSNLATTMLYDRDGRLVAVTVHERLSYLEADSTPSGVTGVAAALATRHREDAATIGEEAVRVICESLRTVPSGIFTVDCKGGADDRPHVTEINARPTNTWLLTRAGVNFADLLARLSLGEDVATVPRNAYAKDLISLRKVDFPPCQIKAADLQSPER
jgi:predicted ATP-grasp superfamily ATP-dependent carboligase